jgi:diguanylate cyclase (GGDEF)-like protein
VNWSIVAAPATPSTLAEDVESWLSAGVAWRFSPSLQRQFDQDTRNERCRTAGLTSLVGAAIGVVLYPVLAAAAPDLRTLSAMLFLGIVMPVTALMALIVLHNPRPVWRELLLALPVALNASVLTYLNARTTADATELYVAAVVLLLVYTCVTVQVRFLVAVPTCAYVFAIYAICFAKLGAQGTPHPQYLIAMTGAIAAYLLLGNWRMHADQKRSFALMLRERLRQCDLTARNRALDELARMDPLTGLANRRAYDVWLEECWLAAGTQGQPLGLLMIDVDRFKAFNDINGHPAGDTCLRTIAGSLSRELSGISDFVARLGGEEFAVLLPGRDVDACAAIAETLRQAIEALGVRHPALGAGRVITISSGAASLVPRPGITMGELCADADAALYRAKQGGRNRVRTALPQHIAAPEIAPVVLSQPAPAPAVPPLAALPPAAPAQAGAAMGWPMAAMPVRQM